MWRADLSVKPRSSFETKVLVAFLAAVLVVSWLAAMTAKVSRDATEAAQWVVHTHEVRDALAGARAETVQIELSTQSFRISGEQRFIAERDASIASRDADLQRLQVLVADNPTQLRRLDKLREVLNKRLALSKQIEQLRKTGGAAAANAFVATAPLKETRELARQLLQELDLEELRLLAKRQVDEKRSRNLMVTAGGAVSLLLFGLLTATYLLIRRQLSETAASQRKLADNEQGLATTLRSIGDAVLATDTAGLITRMNPVAEQLTGWRRSDALGRPIGEVFNIIHEHTREPAEVPVTRVLNSGSVQMLAEHTVLIARDGKEWPIADSAAPIRDESGGVTGVVLVFRDESAQRQAKRMVEEQNELLDQRVRERTAELHQTEDHLRSVISSVPALIAYVDANQQYVYANQQYCDNFASDSSDIAGRSVREILGEAHYARVSPLISQVLGGRPSHYDWQPKPGVWQSIDYRPKTDVGGAVIGYYVVGTDITERKEAEESINILNAELAQRVQDLEQVSRALRTLSAGNHAMLRATDEQGLLESMCAAIVSEGGYDTAVVWYRSDDELKSLRPMAQSGYADGLDGLKQLKVSWADDEFGRGAVGSAIRSGESVVLRDVLTNPNYAKWNAKIQDKTSVLACPLVVNEEVIGALAIYDTLKDTFEQSEIKLLCESADDLAFGIATLRTRFEQQRIQEAVHRLTYHDPLTGLPNERSFANALAAAIEAGIQRDQSIAILQSNIEHLSDINDTLGFSYGDQILREFGERLQGIAPDSAYVARLRGDEFAVLLTDGNPSAVAETVADLERALDLPFPIADLPLTVSAQTGIALFPEHGLTPHDLFRHVDIAVDQARKRGTRHAFFDPEQSLQRPNRLTMATELRDAIDGDQLRVYLQPKVNLASGVICGAEALVRWMHPTKGLVPPGQFIELAEYTGLIKPLTEWVIESVLRMTRDWTSQGCALPIAVNLSARNLRDGELLEHVRRQLKTWSIAEGLFELEITESTLMEDANFALGVLHGLRNEGIPLYVDDFGTGYSSLSYLQKLPVDFIKIDQSFVHNMLSSRESATIVRSTIDLVHDLGRKVVAEGVENQEVWDRLSALGCDIAQGYFIAKPMPADDFRKWLISMRQDDRTARFELPSRGLSRGTQRSLAQPR